MYGEKLKKKNLGFLLFAMFLVDVLLPWTPLCGTSYKFIETNYEDFAFVVAEFKSVYWWNSAVMGISFWMEVSWLVLNWSSAARTGQTWFLQNPHLIISQRCWRHIIAGYCGLCLCWPTFIPVLQSVVSHYPRVMGCCRSPVDSVASVSCQHGSCRLFCTVRIHRITE